MKTIFICEYVTGGGYINKKISKKLFMQANIILKSLLKDFNKISDLKIIYTRDYRYKRVRGLKNITEDDLIIISDLDEIPNPEVINNFQTQMRYAVFKQRHFYYKLNLASKKNPYWYGSRICIKKYLESPQWLRDLKFKKRPFWRIDKFRLNNIIEDGGWHFCNLKNPEQLLYKYKNLCETNDPYVFKEKIDEKFLDVKLIEQNIKLGLDIIGRDESYYKIEIDKSFPEFLKKNINKFKEFIV